MKELISLVFWQRHFVVIIDVLTVTFSQNSENALAISFEVVSDYFEGVEKDLFVALYVRIAQIDNQTVKAAEK